MLFSPKQLTKVVTLLMGNLPHILFRHKSETKDYVVLLFWATSQDESNCTQQKSIQNKKTRNIVSWILVAIYGQKRDVFTMSSITSGSQILVFENAKRRHLPSTTG